MVVCAGIVYQALDQAKPVEAHWAHIIVHGVLHLLGYDHQQHQAAALMEAQEQMLLAELGIRILMSGVVY